MIVIVADVHNDVSCAHGLKQLLKSGQFKQLFVEGPMVDELRGTSQDLDMQIWNYEERSKNQKEINEGRKPSLQYMLEILKYVKQKNISYASIDYDFDKNKVSDFTVQQRNDLFVKNIIKKINFKENALIFVGVGHIAKHEAAEKGIYNLLQEHLLKEKIENTPIKVCFTPSDVCLLLERTKLTTQKHIPILYKEIANNLMVFPKNDEQVENNNIKKWIKSDYKQDLNKLHTFFIKKPNGLEAQKKYETDLQKLQHFSNPEKELPQHAVEFNSEDGVYCHIRTAFFSKNIRDKFGLNRKLCTETEANDFRKNEKLTVEEININDNKEYIVTGNKGLFTMSN